MRIFILLFGLAFVVTDSAVAQRRHEVQYQLGHFSNAGTSFFDYYENAEIRHNFEYDHRFSTTSHVVGWNYPINGHLEFGTFFTGSFESRLELREAESAVFNSEGRALRPDTLFTGSTGFDSDTYSLGVSMRVNLLRFGKFKWYLHGYASHNWLESVNDDAAIIQASHPDLEQAIVDYYVLKERWASIGLGFGLSYALKHGFSIRILEVFGTRPLVATHNYSKTLTNPEFRTGISYQFYSRR